MERISSGQTWFMKRVFPLLWFGVVLAVAAVTVFGGKRVDPVLVAVPAVLLVLGVVLLRKRVWPLADEVRDGGSYLLVRRADVEQRVELSDVVNIEFSRASNPPHIRLRLRQPGRLGREIMFMPKAPVFQLNPFAPNPTAQRLIERVARLRTPHGAMR